MKAKIKNRKGDLSHVKVTVRSMSRNEKCPTDDVVRLEKRAW
jgi:hypothetical protein